MNEVREERNFENNTEVGVNEEENYRDTLKIKQIPDPPDGGWGWLVLFSSFMLLVICK